MKRAHQTQPARSSMTSSAAREAIAGSASPTARASKTTILFMLRNRPFADLLANVPGAYIIKFVYVLGMGRK
ncbi:hypothetical protein BwSH20_31510 [Bradyrhizobium ottawaense]|nr:hypothetical protein BwSF12_36780 [Bradyrhizobium ottawaense]GMO79842.1 hypothetical protein BwSG20_57760 [Bradyrhizobium ottawaense]GMP01265.1 hypothetical protein BwSH20_31510 [Bradyrhizobium ottawaense]